MNSVFYYSIAVLFLWAVGAVESKKHDRNSKSGEDGKIVGGYNTTIEQQPYQVYLLLQKGNSYYQCGGSIISTRYVLTAAHCLTGITKAFIRVGSTDSNSGGTVYTSSVLKSHPQYNSGTSDYDVGLIRFPRAITVDGKTSKIVKMPSSGTDVAPGTELLVSGWGATSENGQTSNTLMAVRVPTVSTEDCRKSYGSSITARMICAGVPQGGKDSCQGDSGGPAVDTNSGNQVGIVSFGVGCARPNYPGVYTKVSSVRSWIRLNAYV